MCLFIIEEYLEESINSIVNQTFEDIEIICIDDGSGDNSLDILNKIANKDSRIKVFSQKNQGVIVARNNAMSMVTGDYVYFDADDYIIEDGLEKAYCNAVNNDSDVAIFKFDRYNCDKFVRIVEFDFEKIFANVDFNNFTFNCNDFSADLFARPYATWFKLYKKDFLDNYNFEFPVGFNHNDVPFHIKTLLKASKISFVPECLYRYREDNPNSISNSCNNGYDHIFAIINVVEDFFKRRKFIQ